MFIFLASLVAFIYLLSRINDLERRVAELKGGKLPQQTSISTQPAPMPVVETRSIAPQPITVTSLLPKTEPARASETPTSSDGTEFAVGAKVFTGIGVLALFIGVGFFLR